MVKYIVENFFLIYLLEFGAAVAGCYYLKRIPTYDKEERVMLLYLWLVLFVETVGLYPVINYFTDYRAFPFVEETLFERNYWWYNSYALIKFPVLIFYYIMKVESKQAVKIFKYLTILFILGGIIEFIFTRIYFTAYSAFINIAGTFIVVILIFLYYFETLKSSRILQFYRLPAFYFSVGILLWHLTVTPLFIYNKYFSMKSPEFVELHSLILRMANIILYSLIILGWLIGANYRTVVKAGDQREDSEKQKSVLQQ